MEENNVTYQLDGPMSSVQVVDPDQPHVVPSKGDAQLIVRETERSKSDKALLLGLGIAGGLGLYALLKKTIQGNGGGGGDPVPVDWPHAGFVGTYYGGPNGLGLLLNAEFNSTSEELNAQHSVWVVRQNDSDPMYLVSEMFHVWRVDQPLTYSADEPTKFVAVLLSRNEWEAWLEEFSIQNQQTIDGDFFPVLDLDVTFTAEEGYSEGRPSVCEVLFPIPQFCGENASTLTTTGARQGSAWRIEKATITISKIKRAKKWLFIPYNGNTAYCRVQVSAPIVGDFQFVTTMRKGKYIQECLKPIMVELHGSTWAEAFLSMGWSWIGNENLTCARLFRDREGDVVYQSSVHADRWEVIRKAVRFWSNKGGLFATGRSAISTLVSGFEAQRDNKIAFVTGNWLNGHIDAIDLSTIFRTLMISPAPVVSSSTTDFPALEYFCWCWLASTDANGWPVADDQVSLPDGTTYLIFPTLLQNLDQILRRGVDVDLTTGLTLREILLAQLDPAWLNGLQVGHGDPSRP